MPVWVPTAVRRWIGPLPQWCPVALSRQDAVAVSVCGAGREADVTRAAVVAALRPLTVAIGLDEGLGAALNADSAPRLRFVDVESRRTVGMLDLIGIRGCRTQAARIGLFEVGGVSQRCLPWPYRSWNRVLQNRAIRKNDRPDNFRMTPEAVQQLMVFYISPRPVVLVSVETDGHSNLFPMDLIGAVSAQRFTLALRNSSQSVPAMMRARRVVLSDVAAADRTLAYELGSQHRNVRLDWSKLPCATARSPVFHLPYPACALRIRELEILDSESIGSHTFFVTRVASEQPIAQRPRLFHTSGIYQHFRARQGRPFPAAG